MQVFWEAKCRVQTGSAGTYNQYVKFFSHIPEGRKKQEARSKKQEARRKREEGRANKINNLRNLKGTNRPGGCDAKQSGDLRFYILYFRINAEKSKAELISFQKKIFSFCLLLSAFCLLRTDESQCYLVVETIVQPGVSFNKD
jgi:hypothetical protein